MASWPVVTTESVPWAPGEAWEAASRRLRLRHRGPYRGAVVPPIADVELALPGAAMAVVEEAVVEITRFDEHLGADVAPFSALLLRSEAAASSQIEHLTASARAVAEAEVGVRDRTNASLVVANARAMDAAIALADEVSSGTLLAMHEALLGESAPRIAGRWRTQPVWIGGTSIGPHEAAYVGPRHEEVPALVDDLVRFSRRTDLPALPLIAVAHAQFETIHPFPDGNGRTGRALVHSLLRHKGLTVNVTVPVSAGLLADTRGYFAALEAYRDGDVEQIVVRVAEAALESLANGRVLVADLRSVRAGWDERVSARRTSAVWQVAALALRQPVLTAPTTAEALGIAPSNVYRYLDLLVEAQVLVESTDRRRNRIWRAPEVLSALDGFAGRVGRRYRETSA